MRVAIDGVERVVPLALVLFLLSHPYGDKKHPPRKIGAPRLFKPEWWDRDEEVVEPRAL